MRAVRDLGDGVRVRHFGVERRERARPAGPLLVSGKCVSGDDVNTGGPV